eukprot:TRINITY_DN8371_c0_g1_i2.p1 TRINITY_DN8371_c0_g1~~TRINITY_DN8371_c0_g1_i2.p1  ORF type:complete len:799 (+),score=103.51 TRINITY_DN8371_c0_g1_i2:1504-3900(+)
MPLRPCSAWGIIQYQYIVSHWWGEPILDFIACIRLHMNAHRLDKHVPYWVCAYCNNQHQLGADLSSDPRKSSFFKAMHISDGMLLVLDETGPATPFSRIWCSFEQSIALSDEHPLSLDIAAVKDAKPHILTADLTVHEKEVEKRFVGAEGQSSGWDLKVKREKSFPLELAAIGMTVSVANSQASQAIDKVRILNSIAGRTGSELDLPAIEGHPAYEELDRKLHALFAVAVWRRALENGTDISDTGELPLGMKLRADSKRRSLAMHFGSCHVLTDRHIDHLSESLPVSLEHLRLDFSHCKLTSVAPLWRRLSQLPLRTLHLNFKACRQLMHSDFAHAVKQLKLDSLELGFGESQAGKLLIDQLAEAIAGQSAKDIHLNLSEVSGATDLASLGVSIGTLTSAEQLHLDFSHLSMQNLEEVGKGIGAMSSLRKLTLSLWSCKALRDATSLAKGLKARDGLVDLNVNLGDCYSLSLLDDFGFSGMSSLRSLTMNFNECKKLTSTDKFLSGLGALKNLREMDIYFGECKTLTGDGFDKGLPGLENLHELKLDLDQSGFRACKELGVGLNALSGLKSLYLSITDCQKVKELESLSYGLAGLISLTRLQLMLCSCPIACIAPLGPALASMTRLNEATFDFSDLGEVTTIAEVCRGFVELRELKKLSLTFGDCSALADIDALAEACHGTSLTSLKLNLCGCNSLVSLDKFGESLRGLSRLQHLEMFLGCDELKSVEGIGKSIASMEQLTSIHLDCESCPQLDEHWQKDFKLDKTSSFRTNSSGAKLGQWDGTTRFQSSSATGPPLV